MRRGHSEALQVQIPAHSHSVAGFAVVVVVVHVGLDKEGVLALGVADPLHALLHRLDDDRGRGGAHVVPHGLVGGHLRRLRGRREEAGGREKVSK